MPSLCLGDEGDEAAPFYHTYSVCKQWSRGVVKTNERSREEPWGRGEFIHRLKDSFGGSHLDIARSAGPSVH